MSWGLQRRGRKENQEVARKSTEQVIHRSPRRLIMFSPRARVRDDSCTQMRSELLAFPKFAKSRVTCGSVESLSAQKYISPHKQNQESDHGDPATGPAKFCMGSLSKQLGIHHPLFQTSPPARDTLPRNRPKFVSAKTKREHFLLLGALQEDPTRQVCGAVTKTE